MGSLITNTAEGLMMVIIAKLCRQQHTMGAKEVKRERQWCNEAFIPATNTWIKDVSRNSFA
jgi:hypothetical protein